MTIKKRIVGVIGLGHVGAHVAYTLGLMGIADEILLCDTNEGKLVSEHNDLMDAVKFMPHRVTYKMVSYEGLGDCDVLVNAVGKISLCASNNRDDEMNFTVEQVAGYVDKVMAGGFKGVWLNITNPCDVITHLIAKLSGLPKGQVLGTGTGLDTARLVHALADQTGLEHHSFTAFMFGEHGNAQMVPWSLVNFAGKPLDALKDDPRFAFDREAMKKDAIGGGWKTYEHKGCTEYGICTAAAAVVSAVLHDEKRILPASVELTGQYGEKDIFVGHPAVIGAKGVEEIMEYNLPPAELEEFKACCAKVRANIAKAAALLHK